jgi:hypothetical protein
LGQFVGSEMYLSELKIWEWIYLKILDVCGDIALLLISANFSNLSRGSASRWRWGILAQWKGNPSERVQCSQAGRRESAVRTRLQGLSRKFITVQSAVTVLNFPRQTTRRKDEPQWNLWDRISILSCEVGCYCGSPKHLSTF